MCVCVSLCVIRGPSNYCSFFVLPNHVPPPTQPRFPRHPPRPIFSRLCRSPLACLIANISNPPPNPNHRLVFLAALPQVLILLFGIMSPHAGLDMAYPGRELPLLICGSSGLLLCGAERELIRRCVRFKTKNPLCSLIFISLMANKACLRSSGPSDVYFYHSVALIMVDSWN